MAVKYQNLLESVSEKTGLDSGVARAAAEATVTVLARTLDEPDRDRFLDAMPGQLKGRLPVEGQVREGDEADFVRAVSLLAHRPPDEARLRARAVLAALAEQEPDLIAELNVPDQLRGMFAPPGVGGGVTGPTGQEAPLTPEEVDAALGALPDWSGDAGELRRTLVLPPGNLDRVLRRIDLLRDEMGRGPEVRRGADGVQLAVRTASVDAVTALDVELASRLDDVIDEAGAGMSS
ncbi:DUF2267 domain-containing protein [Actinomadura sp. 7K507]|uniref:4a-hydroxytetrahydrobiopterin dehydratase n=1 Tax=Actinomadura sp. 7K507 TaxID=2530365 RepID=UPI00104EEBA3|nr:DUF2267 domain-containing protein [Actinomadura sp. 7K507]TDC97587.1 4a-hydroxytetrahydrobiopterin dehydratase [Actinomadura sp. 7K507]